MREIKFRAWDKNLDDWSIWSLGDLINMGSTAEVSGDHFDFKPETWSEYTGLKDKNGVEIYEGDLVKTPAGIGETRWDRCFHLFWTDDQPKYSGSTTLHDCKTDHLEVIGNIYEDPELLKS